MSDQHALLTLTVSLPDIGEKEWRTRIPMEQITGSPSRNTDEATTPSRPTSSSGTNQTLERIRSRVESLDLRSIHEAALSGDYGDSPLDVALALTTETILKILEDERDA
jgi:hypothetical protein